MTTDPTHYTSTPAAHPVCDRDAEGNVTPWADFATCPRCLDWLAANQLPKRVRRAVEHTAKTLSGLVLPLSQWEGRGDWSQFPAEARAAAAHRALAQLDVVISELTEHRAALADALSAPSTPEQRCGAAHAKDPTPCEGDPAAVRVVDREGAETLACVHHGARLYASIDQPRVYPMPGHDGAALTVYNRAASIEPFAWMRSPH